MKTFKQGNWKGSKKTCPICKTNKEGKVVLIPIEGKQEGHNCEAIQIHLDCLDLWWNEESKIIWQET